MTDCVELKIRGVKEREMAGVPGSPGYYEILMLGVLFGSITDISFYCLTNFL